MAAYPVSRYLSIDTTNAPSFSVDGRLLFLSDTTGTPQVWSLSEPGAWPDRLTGHDERVSFVDASPERAEFIFGMDEGSNERDQLFRYDLETGVETRLTDDPEAKHEWGGWSPDGDRFAFTANRRSTDTFDVYVQGRDDDEADLIYEGDEGFLHVVAWGPDGERLVLSEAEASFDQNLSVLSLETGECRRVTDDEEARYESIHVSADDDAVYCVTNHGTDTAYVGRIDLESGSVDVVEAGGEWNVEAFTLHRESGNCVWRRNVDGYSEVHAGRLADGGIEPLSDPAHPAGVVQDAAVAPDGERYALTVSRSTEPSSVYVADFERDGDSEGDAVEAERFTRPGTLGIPRESFRAPETVRYETFDGRDIPAYWTLPEEVPEAGAPVIVDIHGGPEHQRRPWFYPTKQYFLSEGYAVLEPNVRGSAGYGKAYTHLDDVEKRMDSVKDVRAAVEWLSGRDDVDDDRIVAYGRSYGGFMVLAAITEYPDLWAAAVEFVGIADFVTFLENTGEWRRSHREAEYGSLTADREVLEAVSPIHNAEHIACPLFIQHGANDPRVPVGEAEQIAEAVREQGIPVETLIFEDEGHHTTSRENLVYEFERIAAFLDEHV